MELTEKKLESKEIYHGKIVTLRVDQVALPNGKISLREVVEHPGGVGIIAVDENGLVPIVQQYRYAFSREMWEIPAGKREAGEDPLTTAKRELKEEVGATAAEWTALGEVIPSPGCYAERLYLYLATGLTFGETHFDEDEFLRMRRVSLTELTEKCLNGEIQDAKTVIAVLRAAHLTGR